MPIRVDYDDVLDSIIITAAGNIGCEEICVLRDQILNQSNFRKDINQLFDATDALLDLSTEDLKSIASHYSIKSHELGHKRKLALLVSKDLNFGLMRQYEVFFDAGPTVLVQAFRELSIAQDWLKG